MKATVIHFARRITSHRINRGSDRPIPEAPGFIAIALLLVLLQPGCAFDLVRVKQSPATLTAASSPQPEWTLDRDLKVSVGTGYFTRLKAGTRWKHHGSIENGDVFSTSDQIVTVEDSNIREAWLVVNEGMITGFYLPVERTFTAAKPPIQIQTP